MRSESKEEFKATTQENPAIVSLKEKATAGDVKAQFQLGYRYFMGWGVLRDYKKAVPFLELSAAHNYIPAIYWLSRCYNHGLGISRKPLKAHVLSSGCDRYLDSKN